MSFSLSFQFYTWTIAGKLATTIFFLSTDFPTASPAQCHKNGESLVEALPGIPMPLDEIDCKKWRGHSPLPEPNFNEA